MSKRNLAESLLARAIGPTRAAAIFGDLLELASSHGRLWYYTAYIRTLVSLAWRGPAAFLIACMTFILLRSLYMMLYFPLHSVSWLHHPYITETFVMAVFQLWFVVPFAAVKYGVQDRLVRLAFATSVIASCVYYCLNTPVLLFVLTGFALLAIAGLLVPAQWRGAFIVLCITVAIGTLAVVNLGNLAHLGCWVYAHKPLNETSHFHYFETGYAFPHTIFWIVTWTMFLLNMLTLSFVCSRLHRLLWPSSGDAKLA